MSQLEFPLPVSGLPSDIGTLANGIHQSNITAGWWKIDPETGRTLPRNVGELLALVHSEISEADEGWLHGVVDDKLPHRRMAEVELADTAIRVLDMLGFYRGDCVGALPEWTDIRLPGWNGDPQEWIRLMHRTTTAALEGFRKGDVERGANALVDLLGVIHFCALYHGFDLTGAIAEKRTFNATRADHRPEVRAAAGGKAF